MSSIAPIDDRPSSAADERWSALYGEFQPLVRRLIAQYGEEPEARRDLEGTVYAQFCQLAAAYRPDSAVSLRAYLIQTLPGSVYTYARDRWQQRLAGSGRGASGETRRNPGPGAAGPDRALAVLDEVLEALPGAIARLPARQRQVITWRYYESRSLDEIARLLDVQLGAARTLLQQGLNDLLCQLATAGLLRSASWS